MSTTDRTVFTKSEDINTPPASGVVDDDFFFHGIVCKLFRRPPSPPLSTKTALSGATAAVKYATGRTKMRDRERPATWTTDWAEGVCIVQPRWTEVGARHRCAGPAHVREAEGRRGGGDRGGTASGRRGERDRHRATEGREQSADGTVAQVRHVQDQRAETQQSEPHRRSWATVDCDVTVTLLLHYSVDQWRGPKDLSRG